MGRAKRLAAAIVAVALMGGGCEPFTSFDLADLQRPTAGQVGGSLGGGAIGAVAGHAINNAAKWTVTGAAIGLLVGFAIGTYADPPARMKSADATVRAAEQAATGETMEWNTDKSSGQVTPTGAAYADHDRTCRVLHQEETIDGDHSSRDVTACRRGEDIWEVVALAPPGEG